MHGSYDLADYFNYLYERAEKRRQKHGAHTESFELWQRGLRAEFAGALALGIYGEPGFRQSVESLGIATCDGYTREKLTITIAPGLRVPCYILRPEGTKGKLPVALCAYGHGRGACDVLDIPDPCGLEGDPSYQKFFPLSLVRRGYLTVVPEIISFGESYLHHSWQKGEGKCGAVAGNLIPYGGCAAGLRVFEAMRIMDYVETLPEADTARLGMIGISGGGMLTTFTAACDLRIKTAVVCGYINSFKTSIHAMSHCICNYVPGLLEIAEMKEIASLIAPRSLLVSSGSRDRIFPIEATKRTYEELSRLYAELGRPENLESDFFDGPHEISGDRLFDFMDKHLK